jgi:hypothetical protein
VKEEECDRETNVAGGSTKSESLPNGTD